MACSMGPAVIEFSPFATGTSTAVPSLSTATKSPITILPTAVTGITSTPGAANPQVLSTTQLDAVLTALYEKVNDGVVAILITGDEGDGLGSGFVYDTKGHIVTNYHVVENAEDLEVDFISGLKVRAKVVGTDLDSDLAVIKVNVASSELKPLSLGDSSQVKVGQQVVAMGNPFGLSGTMTLGIISAKGRTLSSLRQSQSGGYFSTGDIIQTDASINPGNSGGPLLNLNGEVIGINRAIRTTGTTTTGDPINSGIGFAVPINIVKRVVPVLISSGKYDYPYLGVTFRSSMTLLDYETLGISQTYGAYILEVAPGGPGDQAGLRAGTRRTNTQTLPAGGDLVIGVDGQVVREFSDLISYILENKSPGDKVVLTILRDNQKKEVTLTLGKRP